MESNSGPFAACDAARTRSFRLYRRPTATGAFLTADPTGIAGESVPQPAYRVAVLSYLDNVNRPRIALLDCDDDVRRSLEQAGYDVAVGHTGYFKEHPVADIPAHLHEFELLVVDLDPGWTPRPGDELHPLQPEGPHSLPPRGAHAREPRRNASYLKRFEDALRNGAVLAVLMEGETQPLYVDEDISSPIRGGTFLWVPGAACAQRHPRQRRGGSHRRRCR